MNQSPSKEDVDAALKSLEPPTARSVARQAVKKHRAAKKPSYLTQEAIDGNGRGEGRMEIAMSGTVRFHRRSLIARLLGWLR